MDVSQAMHGTSFDPEDPHLPPGQITYTYDWPHPNLFPTLPTLVHAWLACGGVVLQASLNAKGGQPMAPTPASHGREADKAPLIK